MPLPRLLLPAGEHERARELMPLEGMLVEVIGESGAEATKPRTVIRYDNNAPNVKSATKVRTFRRPWVQND